MESVALVGRLLLSLAVVLGLMWLIARRLKRSGGRGKNGKLIELLSRQQLSRSASVAVVRVLDQALIVGITDGQVAVLGEADLDRAQQALAANEAPKLARPTRPARPVRTFPAQRPVTAAPLDPSVHGARGVQGGALAGSALSLNTWRQTLDTLRDLTARRT
jgi:flagellar protein FliO/FliZ